MSVADMLGFRGAGLGIILGFVFEVRVLVWVVLIFAVVLARFVN